MKDLLQKIRGSEKALLVLSLFMTYAGLIIFSHNSFLYPFNEDFDVNIDIMTGRLLLDGKLPYLDFSTHRGPCSALYCAFVAMFPNGGYLGLFLLECISVGLSFFLMRGISKNMFGKTNDVTISAMFLIWYFSHTFNLGGKCEECFVWIPTFALWTISRYLAKIKDDNVYADGSEFLLLLLVNGFFSGFLFCVKFTFTGAYVGFCLCLFLFAIRQKGTWVIRFLRDLTIFLCGMAIVPILCVIWASLRGILPNMLHGYLYLNLFSYSGESMKIPIYFRIIRNLWWFLSSGLNSYLFLNWATLLFILSVFTWHIRKKKLLWEEKRFGNTPAAVYVAILSVCNLLPILIGNTYQYYLTFTLPFGMFGALTFLYGCNGKQRFWFPIYATGLSLCFAVLSFKIDFITQYGGNNQWVLEFAEEIKKSEDKSLLNIYMETPVGNVMEELPGCKNFCYLNAGAADIIYDQIRMLQEKETEFVINLREAEWVEPYSIYGNDEYTDEYLKENYDLIKTGSTSFYYEGPSIAELWRKKK